jgi:hypothetical protein
MTTQRSAAAAFDKDYASKINYTNDGVPKYTKIKSSQKS